MKCIFLKVGLGIGIGLFLAGVLGAWLNPFPSEVILTLVSVGGLMTLWFKIGNLEGEVKGVWEKVRDLHENCKKASGRFDNLEDSLTELTKHLAVAEERIETLKEELRSKKKHD